MGYPCSSVLEKVPGGQVGYGTVVLNSSVGHAVVVASEVVVGAFVVVVMIVLGRTTFKPRTGFPPTVRSFSFGFTTDWLSLPWPNRAMPS